MAFFVRRIRCIVYSKASYIYTHVWYFRYGVISTEKDLLVNSIRMRTIRFSHLMLH